jgi:hypothetical protein
MFAFDRFRHDRFRHVAFVIDHPIIPEYDSPIPEKHVGSPAVFLGLLIRKIISLQGQYENSCQARVAGSSRLCFTPILWTTAPFDER